MTDYKFHQATCDSCYFLEKDIVIRPQRYKGFECNIPIKNPCNRYPKTEYRLPDQEACGEFINIDDVSTIIN